MMSEHRGSWIPFAALGTAAALLVAVGVIGWTHAAGAGQRTVRDMTGNSVTIDSDALPDADVVKQMDVDTHIGLRFAVPAVGLDVPLAAMNAVDHEITPPGFTEAYWVRNMGTDLEHPDRGTVYIAMHSVRGAGVGPGDYLVDSQNGTARVKAGTVIQVAGTDYRVNAVETISKRDLRDSARVWSDAPGRLVIITCLQRPDGHPSTANLVIFATAP